MPPTPGTVARVEASSRAAALRAPASSPLKLTTMSRPDGPSRCSTSDSDSMPGGGSMRSRQAAMSAGLRMSRRSGSTSSTIRSADWSPMSATVALTSVSPKCASVSRRASVRCVTKPSTRAGGVPEMNFASAVTMAVSGEGNRWNASRSLRISPTASSRAASAQLSTVQGWPTAAVTRGRKTRSRKRSNPRSNVRRTAPGSFPEMRRNPWDRCPGRTRKLSTREARITQITTTGMSIRIVPSVPPTSSSGKNAAMVVSDDDSTGASIRRAPASAEARGSVPRWYCASASSPTTIASSTMMPSVMMSAIRLTMLMLPPIAQSAPSAAMNETGIPTVTQNATRPLRNRNSTATTSTRPVAPFSTSSRVRLRICSQDSSKLDTSTPGGHRPLCSSSQSCRMRADSRLLDPLARLSSRLTAGRPRPSRTVRAPEPRGRRSTVATSPRVTSRPRSSESNGRSSNPISRRCCSNARSCFDTPPRPTLPAGRSRLRAATRRAISASEVSSSRNAADGTWMAISSGGRPVMSILAMPRSSSSRSMRRTMGRRLCRSGPVTSSRATGSWRTTRAITGSSAVDGRLRIDATRSFTSSRACTMSVPSSYFKESCADPWRDEEVTSFRPPRFSSSRSSGAVIAASTSSAVAPVQIIRTVTLSMSKSG